MAAEKTALICLVLAMGLSGAPQQQELPSDCAADGTVVNGLTGQPLLRANVTPNSTNGSGTSTDAEGKWTISNINCGPVVFTAEKDEYIQSVYGRSVAGGVGGAVKPVVLTSGSAAHNLKIELMPEAVVTGRVADDSGDPAPGAQVPHRAINGAERTAGDRAGHRGHCGQQRQLPDGRTGCRPVFLLR